MIFYSSDACWRKKIYKSKRKKHLESFLFFMHTRIWHCSLSPLYTMMFLFLYSNKISYMLATLSRTKKSRKWQTVFSPLLIILISHLFRAHSLTIPSDDENFKIDFENEVKKENENFYVLCFAIARKTFYIPWDLKAYTMMIQHKKEERVEEKF